MGIRSDRFSPAIGRPKPWPAVRCGAALTLAAVVLAACGLPEGAGTLLVDPGRYSAYHCNDLADQRKILVAREKELRGLMDKADAGGNSNAGAIVGSVAYRPEYEAVMSNEKLLQNAAKDKNCPFIAEFQSDQTLR
ncbi:MAG TPA: hypothetical protein VGH13_23270 [Xanthobacteraceae bacterium]|jgi:hypothetical protein